ncbi:hypothetical protein GCM10009800_38670 [Nocardiopsis rhodophaea]
MTEPENSCPDAAGHAVGTGGVVRQQGRAVAGRGYARTPGEGLTQITPALVVEGNRRVFLF